MPAPTNTAGFSSRQLLLDFGDASQHLRRLLGDLRGHEEVLDAFLLAASLQQVLEDHLHRDLYSLGKLVEHLPQVARATPVRTAAGLARVVRSGGLALRAQRPSERLLIGWAGRHAALVQRLADAVVTRTTRPEIRGGSLDEVDALPARLQREVARIPHCFRSYDQRPEDLGRMVDSLSARWPDRTRPVLVVGLRTAGSYLAPLVAAFLRSSGFVEVDVLTLRPGQHRLRQECGQVEVAARRGALVVIVDEPPRSGSQLILAARELEDLGVTRRSLVLLVPLFGSALPRALASYETVSLAWEDWAIHHRLMPDAVAAEIGALLPGWRVERVERVHPCALRATPRRGHVTALFRVRLVDRRSGACREQHVAVEGVGLGYLGRHALEVGAALSDYVPEVYGVRDGLLYRKWLPEEWRQTQASGQPLADRIASYVVQRNRALGVSEDMTARLRGRDTASDLVAAMLSETFGRGAVCMRPLLRGAAQRLLVAARPSVIDGSMTLDHWFAPRGGERAAHKVDFHARAFSNEDRTCYDPVYDLACAAASAQLPSFQDALLRTYENLSGQAVAPERWLLYQLLHHRFSEQPKARAEGNLARYLAAERAMARAHQRYFAGHFFSGLDIPTSGPLCAIDVDWVLEVRWLGFPAMSPASAGALIALARHGYRPIIATGRSLGEVKERCAGYRLAGGVAEYGAAVYDHVGGLTHSLLSAEDAAVLEELRGVLRRIPDVHLDPAREHSIRAYRIQAGGPVGLDWATISAALDRTGSHGALRAIPTRSQTDFVAADSDKGRGLRVLAELLGEGRIALAVGDTSHDLPMLRIAEWAGAPANAERGLLQLAAPRPSGVLQARQPYGAGLLEVVSVLLGHRTGRCPACAPPPTPTAERALLLSILRALDGGGREKAQRAAALAGDLAKALAPVRA